MTRQIELKKSARWKTMLNTKKTICQSNHSNEVLYSGFVTAVTPKNHRSPYSALDAEADVLNQPPISVFVLTKDLKDFGNLDID